MNSGNVKPLIVDDGSLSKACPCAFVASLYAGFTHYVKG